VTTDGRVPASTRTQNEPANDMLWSTARFIVVASPLIARIT
jgi:hypothetical protein